MTTTKSKTEEATKTTKIATTTTATTTTSSTRTTTTTTSQQKAGPNPILISRTQVDALYDILDAIKTALTETLNVPWIITSGGSLLGACRQHSILFTDDDIDIAILDIDNNHDDDDDDDDDSCGFIVRRRSSSNYENVLENFQNVLGDDYSYIPNAWDGGGRVRLKRISNVFVDIFHIRKYNNENEFRNVISVKKNGQQQSISYINDNINKNT